MLPEQWILILCERGDGVSRFGIADADVPGRDERIPLQPACVVSRHVEAVVATDELLPVGGQPLDERDVRLAGGRRVGAALLDPAVPRTDVLADVAAVDLRAEVLAVGLRNRRGRLRRVRETACRVERPRLVERPRRAGVDAEPAGAAVEGQARRRLELEGGDE